MIEAITITAAIVVLSVLFLFANASATKRKKALFAELESMIANIKPESNINIDTTKLEKSMQDVPNKVLQAIQGSTNTKKGALGELIGYIELQAQYDRLIALGNIVDFIGIRFDRTKDGKIVEPGIIDFIDIKTGKSARLSVDQKKLQYLIKNKQIGFTKVKVSTDAQIK